MGLPPRFEVVVLLSTRFAGNNGADAETASILKHAARSVTLPADLPGARRAVAGAKLDVLVYAELGEVDPFIYSLAFSRLAPVQAKFWGHFGTSGLSSLDYYLTADAFTPERWGGGRGGGGGGGEADDDHHEGELVRLVIQQGSVVMWADRR